VSRGTYDAGTYDSGTYDAGPPPLVDGLDLGQAPPAPGPAATAEGDPEHPGASLLRLALIVIAVFVVAIAAGVGETVAIVAALILMIMLHEFGHFITAKWADMKVTEYFLGFGPRLWSIRRGETEYGVKSLPLGGYVKIVGMTNLEEVDPADEPRAYREKPYLRRLSVALAGSTMHFLLAFILLFALFFATGRPGDPTNQVGSLYRLSTGPSPAQSAGFKVGDRIISVDGRSFATLDEQGQYIRSKPGQRIDVKVERDGRVIDLYPTPVDLSKVTVEGAPVTATPNQPDGFIGIGYAVPTIHYGFISSIDRSGGLFVDISARTFDALGSLLSAHGVSAYGHMLTSTKAADAPNAVRFSSPVGIVRVANQAAKTGFSDVLTLLILINIFVGIFNLLPLLPLDGGHVAIATYEAVRSRKGRHYHADVTKLMPLTYGVFLLLVFIGGSALFLDVRDLISMVRI
jgi:membrane-associated protease RseP (regulator of RpoE activity)